MAVDLSDLSLRAAYEDLLHPDGSIDWLILTSKSPSTQLSLVEQGKHGLEELRTRLRAEQVLFGLLRVEGRVLLWSQIPHTVGGVKRARALVQERTVTDVLQGYTATLRVGSPAELDASAVAIRLFHHPALLTSRPRTASPPISPSIPSPKSRQHSSTAGSTRRPSVPETILARKTSVRTNGLAPGFAADTPPIQDASMRSARATESDVRPPQSLDQALSTPAHPSYLAQVPTSSGSHPATGTRDPLPSQPPVNTPVYNTFATTSLYPQPGPSPDIRPHSASPPGSPALLTTSPNVSGIFDSAAAAMLVASASDPSLAGHALSAQGIPIDVAEDDASVARAHPPEADSAEGNVDPHSVQLEAEQKIRALELGGRDEVSRVAREHRERDAEEAVVRSGPDDTQLQTAVNHEPDAQRQAVDEEGVKREAEEAYRQQAEAELERERVAEEARRGAVEDQAWAREQEQERQRIAEEEEAARREEEARRAEEEARRAEEERLLLEQQAAEERRLAEEAERARLEQEEQTRQAEEEMRLLIERQRAEKLLREKEEARLREAERQRVVEERKRRLAERRHAGDVMLAGTVNVQGGGSMLWRRRYFRLTRSTFDFYRSETDADAPIDSIRVDNIERLDTNPEEALVPHAFKATLKDGEERLFYYLSASETEALVEALECAMAR